MFNRFTDRCRHAMAEARRAAAPFNHNEIGPEHMLLGVLAVEQSMAATALRATGADLERLRAALTSRMVPNKSDALLGALPFTHAAKQTLETTLIEAQNLGHDYLGTAHVLLAVLRLRPPLVDDAVDESGVTLDAIEAEVRRIAPRQTAGSTHGTPNRLAPLGHVALAVTLLALAVAGVLFVFRALVG